MTGPPGLVGRHCVVSGAAGGIGAAVARRFAAEGAGVSMLDLDAERLELAAAEVVAATDPTRAPWWTRCDVRSRADVEGALARAREVHGPVDVVAAVAGTAWHVGLEAMTDDDLDAMLDVHVRGTFHLLRAVVPEWRARRTGSFIAVSSPAAVRGQVDGSAYSAAKAALHGLVRSAARELGPHGVRVNAVLPMAETPMTEATIADPDLNATYLARIPLGRWGHPDEVAAAFCFLAGDEASYVTGVVLPVDGGRTI